MKIGVVKEIKTDEYRVALTPAGALELVAHGHEVAVETGAGDGSSFADATYEASERRSARVEDAGAADLVLKVKEPLPAEYALLRQGQVLFTYLHLAASAELTRALVESGGDVRRVRDGRDPERHTPAARPDERDRGPALRPGRRVLPGEAARRPRAAARRRRRAWRPGGC